MFPQIDIETFLRNIGLVARYIPGARKWVASCPNPDHRGDTSKDRWDQWIFRQGVIASWSINDRPGERGHGSHHCHSCKFGGGPWELAAMVWGCTLEEAGKRIGELFYHPTSLEIPRVTVRVPREKKVFELPSGVVIPGPGGRWFGPALRYLESRGITREQADRWGLGYAVRGRLVNRVIFPVYTEGELRTYSARAIAPGMKRYDAGLEKLGAQPKRALFGEPLFDRSIGIVTVAEGCPSTLALERAGAPNPAGMLGSYLTPDRARMLSTFPAVLIATDPDAAGEKVAQWLDVLSRRAKVRRISLELAPDDTPQAELEKKVKKTLDSL